jgi:hypothetical protein
MKAAILIESLTGKTWKAGEQIAANLQQRPRRHNPGQQACGA